MNVVLGILIVWNGDLLVDILSEPLYAWRRILMPIAVLAVFVWRSWPRFRLAMMPAGRKSLSAVGPANYVTLCRGFLICALGEFIVLPQPKGLFGWVPAIIYASVSAVGLIDVVRIRACDEIVPAGEILDREIDALGTVIAAVLSYGYGRLPAFYLPVSCAYYLFSFAVWVRMKHGRPLYSLQPSRIRNGVRVLQALLITILLAPLVGPVEGLWIAIALTLVASLSFVKDWMAVIGAGWRVRRWRSGR
jgi:phosphatidylglycerophosphate synthase